MDGGMAFNGRQWYKKVRPHVFLVEGKWEKGRGKWEEGDMMGREEMGRECRGRLN